MCIDKEKSQDIRSQKRNAQDIMYSIAWAHVYFKNIIYVII